MAYPPQFIMKSSTTQTKNGKVVFHHILETKCGASVVVVALVPLLQRYEGRQPFHCLSAQLDLAW